MNIKILVVVLVATMTLSVRGECAEGGGAGSESVIGLIRDYCTKNSGLGIEAALTSDQFTQLQGLIEARVQKNERVALRELQFSLMDPKCSEAERLCVAYVLMSTDGFNTSGQSIELIIDVLEGDRLSPLWRERTRSYLYRNCMLTTAQKKRLEGVVK